MTRVMAVIPARGGSKGIPRKNLVPVAGRPLIAWTVEAALTCEAVAETWVSTEDEEIARVALSLGAGVIPRPMRLAMDDSSSTDVMRHAWEWRAEQPSPAPAAFVMLQPTSPLRNAAHISEALALFSGDNSVVSVCEAEHHPLKMVLQRDEGVFEPLGAWADLQKPRQSLPKAYRQNGAIYVMRWDRFLERDDFVDAQSVPYVMERRVSLDVDQPPDLAEAERAINLKWR